MLKISVITATYNSGETIKDTIQSVLSQNYSNYEHIIVDGASKDNTMAVVNQYREEYDGKLKTISEPDHGIYDAMNKGIKMATGDVIGILNSDDFFTSDDVLSTVNEALGKNEVEAVYGDIHFVNQDDLTRCVRYYSSRKFKRGKMLMGYQPAHPSFYCRARCYKEYGAFDTSFKIAADFENMLRLIYVNKIPILYLNKDFVTMRQGGASTSGISSHMQALKDHYRAYKKYGLYAGYMGDVLRFPSKVGEVIEGKLKK